MITNRLEQAMLNYGARRGKRLTLNELAEGTGIAISTISRFGSGKNIRLDYNTLDKLCAFLECQPGDLLNYVPNVPDVPV